MASDPNHSQSYKVFYVMSLIQYNSCTACVMARPFTAFLTVDPVMCTRDRPGLNKFVSMRDQCEVSLEL